MQNGQKKKLISALLSNNTIIDEVLNWDVVTIIADWKKLSDSK